MSVTNIKKVKLLRNVLLSNINHILFAEHNDIYYIVYGSCKRLFDANGKYLCMLQENEDKDFKEVTDSHLSTEDKIF